MRKVVLAPWTWLSTLSGQQFLASAFPLRRAHASMSEQSRCVKTCVATSAKNESSLPVEVTMTSSNNSSPFAQYAVATKPGAAPSRSAEMLAKAEAARARQAQQGQSARPSPAAAGGQGGSG